MAQLLTCLHCAKEVAVPAYRLSTFKFCSRSCGALHNREHHVSTCGICGSSFKHISSRSNKAKYCSRSCYYKSLRNKGSVRKNCVQCGTEFGTSPSHNKDFCSVRCTRDHQMLDTTQPKTFAVARKWMLRRGLLNSCADCGYAEHKEIIGVHHIDENRHNNNPSNLVALCPNCHSIRHMKHTPH